MAVAADSQSPLSRVLDALRLHGREPAPNGSGWSCRCPSHDDNRASLSISECQTSHKVLVHCFAGCKPEAIVAALALTLADLFHAERNGKDTQRTFRENYD